MIESSYARWLALLLGWMVAGQAGAVDTAADGPVRAAVPSAAPTLDLWAIDIEGDSLLGEVELYRLMQPYLGPARTLDDVDRARDVLEARYRALGYKSVAVTIPRQTARDGIVRLEVVEGRVERLTVSGSRYHSIEQIKLDAPSLAVGQVPDFDQVQQDILALNRSDSLKVTPSLQPGSRPGTLKVDLAVTDELPVKASLEVNNRQSANTEALRVMGSLSWDNLFQRGHSLSASYQTAPQRTRDAQVLFLSYLWPFGRSGYSLVINGIKSDSDVAAVGGLSVIGRGEILGARLMIELPGSDRFFPSAAVGFDYKHFRSAIATTSASVTTPITYVPFVAGLNFVATGGGGVTQGNALISVASPQIGSQNLDFNDSRFAARGQQLSYKQSLSRTQNLPHRLALDVRMSAQLTDQPLISNEQFSTGGADSVRGYLESEALGDYGFSGTAELRWAPIADGLEWSPGLVPVDQLRVYGYVDGARLLLRKPLPAQDASTELLSVGAGLSFTLFSMLEGSVDYAVPMRDGPIRGKGDGRLLFRVSSSY